jgi:hypothetical protein
MLKYPWQEFVRVGGAWFLGLRNQVDSQEGSLGNAQGNNNSNSKAMGNWTEHHLKHVVLTPQRSPFLGSGSKTGGGNANAEKSKDSKHNSIVDGSGEDCHVGLKLGKRTYYSEDANVGGNNKGHKPSVCLLWFACSIEEASCSGPGLSDSTLSSRGL